MKKILLILPSLVLTMTSIAQMEIFDVIHEVHTSTNWEDGEEHCTSEFWTAKVDGGAKTFRRLARLNEAVTLEVSDTKVGDKRLVYVVDLMAEGKKRDELYAFMIKEKGKWLLDGFHEENETIDYFLNGKLSGHFSPLDLPSNEELDKYGADILAFGKDQDAVIQYCKDHFNIGSNLRFAEQLTSTDYAEVRVISTGYSEYFKRGFIYFEQDDAEGDWKSEISIFVIREENDQFRIYLNYYTKPWVSGFFYDD